MSLVANPSRDPLADGLRNPLGPEQAAWFRSRFDALAATMGEVLLGKDRVIRLTLTCLLSEGHLLLEDLPGTGKTMLARAFGNAVEGTHARIQFTPDLLPSDVTGVTVYDQHKGSFAFHPGPIPRPTLPAPGLGRGPRQDAPAPRPGGRRRPAGPRFSRSTPSSTPRSPAAGAGWPRSTPAPCCAADSSPLL